MVIALNVEIDADVTPFPEPRPTQVWKQELQETLRSRNVADLPDSDVRFHSYIRMLSEHTGVNIHLSDKVLWKSKNGDLRGKWTIPKDASLREVLHLLPHMKNMGRLGTSFVSRMSMPEGSDRLKLFLNVHSSNRTGSTMTYKPDMLPSGVELLKVPREHQSRTFVWSLEEEGTILGLFTGWEDARPLLIEAQVDRLSTE